MGRIFLPYLRKEMMLRMKLKHRLILMALLLVVALLAAGCKDGGSIFQQYDAAGCTVSVKFDANGGYFTTNTSVIWNYFDPTAIQPGSDGKVQIPLLSPEDEIRGNNAFTAVNNGYFLAGWYAQRTETIGEDGKTQYVYAEPWDFNTDVLSIDPNGSYTSAEPVLTLYAAWVPLFEIQLYDRASGECVSTMTFDPSHGSEFALPAWDVKTGAMEMHQFPQRKGYTFNGAYYDPYGQEPVAGETILHPGTVDYVNGAGKNGTLKLYVDYLEGEWYQIHNAAQFVDHASVSGNYILCADLDFSDEIWPTSLMYGNFSGTIQGNGHTISNVAIQQKNNSKTNAGLFGTLSGTITDVRFDNITFTIQSGARVAGASYGLFAGTISESAVVSGVSIMSSTLQISSDCYFGTSDYVIGLVCGMGDHTLLDWEISCVAVGDEPEKVIFTVDGNTVTLQ